MIDVSMAALSGTPSAKHTVALRTVRVRESTRAFRFGRVNQALKK
jgi:hypothetical protein